ncbi:TPA: hypothetical protein L2B14_002186 [Klebsiella oxytoca]|nr:hypothetical protein [Klebsiella oxytoca]
MIPDKDLTDDVLDEIIAGAKTSMEQYLALSLKAEREVWRKEVPTDDERIMAIEGIHNCERCGDEGWVVGEIGITRCACGQASNSPVIGIDPASGPDRTVEVHYVVPPGYVVVPKEPTDEMIAAAMNCEDVLFNSDDSFCIQFVNIYEAMLAAAPKEVK